MQLNDTSASRSGLIQDAEDICGLGATGISSNTTLLSQFVRWMNQWNQKAVIAILKAMDGFDFDDSNYERYPSGTFVGTTNRDYAFGVDQDGVTQKLLKIKNLGISRDGTNYIKAKPIDSTDLDNVKADDNIDSLVPTSAPVYDPKVGGFDIYPKFTQAEVDAGAKVYVEFWREPVDWDVTGTDTQEPGFASSFHPLISKGASLEYAKLYKPEIVPSLTLDIFGNNANIPGIFKEMETFYSRRYPKTRRMTPNIESTK
jgi:hypothetical protein